jgi:dephospho-CoA kinase
LLNEIITIIFSCFILSGFHVYGITGQICSGKTSACDYLKRKYGATIISLDDLNREILRKDSVIKKIKKIFGEGIIKKEYGIEVVNRSELKKIIFNDKAQRKKLENITHPKVIMLFIKTLCVERFLNMKKYIFIENAILLRFNLFKMIIKGVISICVSDENILVKRMMKRDNNSNSSISEETARNILKNQMPLHEYKLKSDVVIYNDENYQNLELKIDELMRDIIKYSKNDKLFIR